MKKLLFITLLSTTNIYAQHTIEVKHKYYTMQFDTVQSAEILGFYVQTTAHSITTPKIKREGKYANFTKDPAPPLQNKVLANDNEYEDWNRTNTTHPRDRGHVNPYTAFDFAEDAALETNYFSNTCPQSKYFNEHQWEQVEQYVLKLSRGYDSLSHQYKIGPIDNIKVWTGVLISTAHPKKMKDVPEPDFYWKVIQYKQSNQTITRAWLGLNEDTNRSTNPDDIVANVTHLKQVVKQYYPMLKLDF